MGPRSIARSRVVEPSPHYIASRACASRVLRNALDSIARLLPIPVVPIEKAKRSRYHWRTKDDIPLEAEP
jgi:hypothetical protein